MSNDHIEWTLWQPSEEVQNAIDRGNRKYRDFKRKVSKELSESRKARREQFKNDKKIRSAYDDPRTPNQVKEARSAGISPVV